MELARWNCQPHLASVLRVSLHPEAMNAPLSPEAISSAHRWLNLWNTPDLAARELHGGRIRLRTLRALRRDKSVRTVPNGKLRLRPGFGGTSLVRAAGLDGTLDITRRAL